MKETDGGGRWKGGWGRDRKGVVVEGWAEEDRRKDVREERHEEEDGGEQEWKGGKRRGMKGKECEEGERWRETRVKEMEEKW